MSELTTAGARYAMPANTVRVNLPCSEVCMHMRVAGREHWVAQVAPDAAQIYNDNGEPFSAPILLAEAGLDTHGQPQELHKPACMSGANRNPTGMAR